MPTQAVSGRIRLGILALVISTALFFVSFLVSGPLPESPDDIRAWAEFASSSRYAVSDFLLAVASLLAIFGFVALYACMAGGRAERWAFFAMILSVAGSAGGFATHVGASGIEALAAEQYLEGQRAVLEEWFDLFEWTSVFSLLLRPVLFVIGTILFGVAIWRSQTLPQGAAILWFASLLLSVPGELPLPVADISFHISMLLLITACGWILWSVSRQPTSTTPEQLMPAQRLASRIRLGILALPAGTALILAATVVGGSGLASSPDDVRAYAEFAASTRYTVFNFLFAVGALLVLFGFIALYAAMANGRAGRWAFFAMILCVPGIASAFAYSARTSGVEAVAARQYLQGQRAVLEEWLGLVDWSTLFLLVTNAGLFTVGLILFGVAIWRSGTLPQGAAILWSAYVLISLATPLSWVSSLLAFLLATVANGWIAWSVWQQPSPQVAGSDAGARVQ